MTRLGLAALALVLVASEPRPPSAAGVPALPGASGSGGSIQSAAPDLALEVPRARQTGTTIAGVVCRDGVVLGADTRATEGTTVCDKRCDKVCAIFPRLLPRCRHITRPLCLHAGASARAQHFLLRGGDERRRGATHTLDGARSVAPSRRGRTRYALRP